MSPCHTTRNIRVQHSFGTIEAVTSNQATLPNQITDMTTAALVIVYVLSTFGQCVSADGFDGKFVEGSGIGDTDMLKLLDIARRQFSASEYNYQSILNLYRGDWDGLLEGPGWTAWWTQNSYGPVMAGLPFIEPVSWHALQHSMGWWFDSIGNGTKYDSQFGTTRDTEGGQVRAGFVVVL